MTAASYSWPRFNIISNGSFAGTSSTGWTNASGTADFSVSGGVKLDKDEALRQDIKIKEADTGEADAGRWLSRYEPLKFDLKALRVSGTMDAGSVVLFLRKAGTSPNFFYDWQKGEWVPFEPDANWYDASAARFRWSFGFTSSETAETHFHLPKVAPISSAGKGGEVDDTWSLRVGLMNNSSATAVLQFNEVRLSIWGSDIATSQLGSTTVISNGRNYPVKYDAKVGRVTELSLPAPYHFATGAADSNLPTIVHDSGGSLGDDNYYGYGFTFLDTESGEESGPPVGAYSSSGLFTEQASQANDQMTLAFGHAAFIYPNAEAADQADGTDDGAGPSAADNARIIKVAIYRTLGSAEGGSSPTEPTGEDTAKPLLFDGLAYLEGVTEKGGEFVSEMGDDALYERSTFGKVLPVDQIPAPAHKYSRVFRNRVWTAGGPTFENGTVTATNASHFVVGVDRGSAKAPTLWNRSVEGMLFQVDGENEVYRIEKYIYPDDDTTGSTHERIYLSAPYKGSTAAVKSYRIWPESGKVQYSEEGKAWRFSSLGYFLCDGGKGEEITGIGHAENSVVVWTRNKTYAFGYEVVPDAVEAAMVSGTVGCIAHDSFVEIDGTAYWLSDKGVYRWTPSRSYTASSMEQISAPISDIFTNPADPDYIKRTSDGQLPSACTATHYPARQQYLLAVGTRDGGQGANMVLVYNYVFQSWDILRLDVEIARWFWATNDAGEEILMFSDTSGNVFRWDSGLTDGCGDPGAPGTIRGTATAATATTLTDSNATFFTYDQGETHSSYGAAATSGQNLNGVWVEITGGTGAGQKRRILRNSSTALYLEQAWDVTPDTTSTYEVGGINAQLNLKASNIGVPGRIKRLKQVNMDLKTEGYMGRGRVKVFRDFSGASVNQVRSLEDKSFVTSETGRTAVGTDEASGYYLKVQVEADGSENPLEIRSLSGVIEVGERD